MYLPQRLIAGAVLVALSGALAGCGGGGMSSFDPMDMLDFLDTKKKLPGERKPVFPEGVPGVEQGVPRDLYKGAQADEVQEMPPQVVAPEPEPQPRSQPRASRPRRAPAASAAPPTPERDTERAPAPASPPAARKKHVSPTALPREEPAPAQPQQQPPPLQQPQQQELPAFPAPLPSGSFSQQ